MSPEQWVSRCHIRIGSVCGTRSGLAAVPPVNTGVSAKAGRNVLTGSMSSKAPCSHSIMAATEVTGLVIE